jgi:hypothetical protein
MFSICSAALFGIMTSASPDPNWSTRAFYLAVCLLPVSLLLWRARTSWKSRELAFSGEALAAR